jgi:hypothetical protein
MNLMPRVRLLLPAAALLVGLFAVSSPAVASTPSTAQQPPSKAVVVLIGANDYGIVGGWPKP